MASRAPQNFQLSNGVSMPSVGLGTYRVRYEAEISEILQSALDCGYRMIDTAQVYRNEAAIGNLLHSSFTDTSCSLKREDIFITTKLAPKNQGYDACYKCKGEYVIPLTEYIAICDSLLALKVDYIDLFLIHWPGTQGVKRDDGLANAKNRAESWRAMEQAYRENKARAIGVSNYTASHLNELLETCQVRPVVNQVEVHPFYPQSELHQLCSKANVLIQAYSSFGEGSLLNPSSAHHQVLLKRITQRIPEFDVQHLPRHLLHWALSKNISVIPKSSTPERIASNFEVFNFPVDDKIIDVMNQLLSDGEVKPIKFCWDPLTIS